MYTTGTKDSEALSVNGEDLTIAMAQEVAVRVDPADLPVLDRRHRVDIATSGGQALYHLHVYWFVLPSPYSILIQVWNQGAGFMQDS